MIGNVYSCFHYLQKCIKSAFRAEDAANRAEEYANSLEPETFVKKSGNQTIGGDLTIDKDGFQTIFFQSPDIDYTSVEQTNLKGGRILELDKSGQYYGYFQSQVDANGAYSTAISTRRSVGGANKSSTISTVVDKNGNIYTSAPTPATSDNSTKIATTAWVNNKKADITSWGCPSDKYIDLGTVTSYKAPADGIICWVTPKIGDWNHAEAYVGVRTYYFHTFGNTFKGGWFEVNKNETVTFNTDKTQYKRFIYKKGAS